MAERIYRNTQKDTAPSSGSRQTPGVTAHRLTLLRRVRVEDADAAGQPQRLQQDRPAMRARSPHSPSALTASMVVAVLLWGGLVGAFALSVAGAIPASPLLTGSVALGGFAVVLANVYAIRAAR